MPQKTAFHLGLHCLHKNEGIYNFKEKVNHGDLHNIMVMGGSKGVRWGGGGVRTTPGKLQVAIGFLRNSGKERNYGCYTLLQ